LRSFDSSVTQHFQDLLLEPADNDRLAKLCGQLNEHLRLIEHHLDVEINNRGNHFRIIGDPSNVSVGITALQFLYDSACEKTLTASQVHLSLQEIIAGSLANTIENDTVVIRTRRGLIRARTPNQQNYLLNILRYDVNFGVGPAGTGKTYLAVACALEALEREQVRRLVLVRPAVEAGERLGFLPGDMNHKIDPYLRPLYDALYEMLGFERVAKLMEKNIIEIAPLAFMRGRTLNESFIILDEAQNTTVEQMKMFLTRIGFGSKAVITGDITQTDLPRGLQSGLSHALPVLKNIENIAVTYFNASDVVRHPVVQQIVAAYDRYEQQKA